jgi:transposase
MNFIGIDLHKKTISVCVVNQERKVLRRKSLDCVEPDKIVSFFEECGAFAAVVEATASYEWLWRLLEPLAQRLVLAHPKKLRVIAESKNKSDRLDAQVLAEFLALGMIPEAYRPTLRQRQHRTLVRQRCFVQKNLTRVRNKIRRVLSDYNADRRDLFTAAGLKYLKEITKKVSEADRFVLNQLLTEWQYHRQQFQAVSRQLKAFAQKASAKEQEIRTVLGSMPAVGPTTIEVVLSEIGDIERFRSQKRVVAYAGLAPGHRQSAGHKKDLGITKQGSGLLRWVLIQTAWRTVRCSLRWRSVYENLKKRRGSKRAIVAVARRLLTVMAALWRTGQLYRRAEEGSGQAVLPTHKATVAAPA